MSKTAPDVLAMLRDGTILPVYWRRKRATAKWHRGFRIGTQVVHSQCDKVAGVYRGNLYFAPVDAEWPEPHCPKCERATPGSDAAREGLDVNEGVSSRPPRRSPA